MLTAQDLKPKYILENIGIISCSGNDIIDFINRMSTNDFRKFPANEFRSTVFTTDKGRIEDFATVINTSKNVLLVTSLIYKQQLKEHLEKYIITDDVLTEFPEEEYVQFMLFGNDILGVSEKIFSFKPEANKVYELNDTDLIFYDNFRIDKLILICKRNQIDNYESMFVDLEKMDMKTFEELRINYGIPRAPNELNEGINPVECGLNDFISYTKGCYIGQEVIARLDSQGKIPKQMVKIDSEKMLSDEEIIYCNKDTEAGFVSSSLWTGERYIGLGFIRSVNLDFNGDYFTNNEEGVNRINISKIT